MEKSSFHLPASVCWLWVWFKAISLWESKVGSLTKDLWFRCRMGICFLESLMPVAFSLSCCWTFLQLCFLFSTFLFLSSALYLCTLLCLFNFLFFEPIEMISARLIFGIFFFFFGFLFLLSVFKRAGEPAFEGWQGCKIIGKNK